MERKKDSNRVGYLLLPVLQRFVDACGQLRVEQVHVLLEGHLAGHELVHEGDLPVGSRCHGSMLRLSEGVYGCLDDGRCAVHGLEVIVEHSLADDVKGEGAEAFLHISNLNTEAMRGHATTCEDDDDARSVDMKYS